jgi:uracil-DNA glycosylase family 4
LDYPTLLLKLENQLQSLHKKGFHYMNIEAMPKVELRRLLDGLGEILDSPTEDVDKRSKYNFSVLAATQPAVKIKHENADSKLFPFKQIIPEPEAELKVNSLSELADKYKSCQRCSLGKTRTNLVFGNGSINSRVIFLGEGPGADEDAQGQPFVGRAGRLLTKMINSIGIERDDVYITNIVKCRPPENRNPTPAEISCCLPIIKQQLELLNPKLIVTLGNIPTKSLFQDLPGITKVRGIIMQYENWNVLPTFHPSYLLRNRSAMTLAWEDFKKIPELAFDS